MFVEKIRDNYSVGEAVKAIHNFSDQVYINKCVALYGCPEVALNLPNSPPIVPGPATFSATYISPNQIDLSWSGVTDAVSYVIERAEQTTADRKRPEGWTELTRVSGTPPACTYSDRTVVSDKVYLYRVWANTSTSKSGYSSVDSASTFDQSLLPQVPLNLRAAEDCYSATISWDPPATVQPGTYYKVKRRHDSGTTYSTVICVTGTTYLDNNLLNDNTYHYRVSTVNRYGESADYPIDVSVTPQLLALTSGPVFKNLENVRCNSFELVFTKSIDNGVMFYEVEYYYDQDIVGTPNRVSKTKRFSRARGGEAFDGLDNNQTVHFRIRAGNDAEYDESSWTGWNDGTTSAGNPPETPLNFTINQITPLTARLSFTPAPGSLTHGYEIYHKVESELSGDNGLFRKIMEIDNSSATVEVSTGEGLIDSFAIRAFNDDPNCGRAFSAYSEKIYTTSNYWPVNAPENLRALCISPNEISLTWIDQASGETGYRIERRVKTGRNWSSWSFLANTAANVSSYTDNSVSPGNVYEYRVRASCPASMWPGYSDWSVTASASTSNTDNFPEIPWIGCQTSSPTEITLSWNFGDKYWVNAQQFTLQQSSDHGDIAPSDATYSTIATLFTNSYTVAGLTPGVNYWFRVNATNWAGTSDFSEPFRPFQTAPAAPSNLTAVAVSGSIIQISWNDNSTNESYFSLEYVQMESPIWNNRPETRSLSSNITSTVIDFLQPNKKYWFRIRASNEWGSSGYSNETFAITLDDVCQNVESNGSGLNGAVFGVGPSVSAGNEYCKATDGNINTFYGSAQPDGAYTGIRFYGSRIVNKIRFYPRAGYAHRMLGGKFQGSDTPDFAEVEDLYTITSMPASGWNEVTISNTTPFYYVRYLGPNGSHGNIAEMEFYEAPTTYNISASADFGTISPDGDISVNSHASQTFSIVPDALYKIGKVEVDYESVGAVSSYTFNNVTRDHKIKVTCVPETKYEAENAALDYGAFPSTEHPGYSGTGYVMGFWMSSTAEATFTVLTDGPGDYAVNLRYSAGMGTSTNVGFYVNGVKIKNLTCPGTGNWQTWSTISETVVLTEGINEIRYKAESAAGNPINLDFIEIVDLSPRTINATARFGGEISPSGDIKLPYGSNQTFTITPEPLYEIDAVLVDGVNVGKVSSYTFNNITQDHTIEATFERIDKYEAENATLSGTANIAFNHSGFSGMGFVDGFWRSNNAGVLFRVNQEYTGSYLIKLRYSAGAGTSTNVGLYVDGMKIKNLTCPGTGNWDTWATVSEMVTLTNGAHEIEYRSESSSGNPINLDYLRCEYIGLLIYEAEDAGLLGTAHKTSYGSGYSGKGFVDGYLESTTASTFIYLDVKNAGTYEVRLRYSAGNGTSTNIGFYVNGVKIKNLTCPGTGDWDTWAEISETINILQPNGYNDIEFRAETSSSQSINIDKITLVPLTLSSPMNLKVYMLDQTPGNNQQTQPRFYIKNEGDTPLSNFTMKYYFTVEDGKTPVVDNYYMAPYCNAVITPISGNDYCATITFNVTLPAGGRIPENDGLNFSLHYSDWSSSWNTSNDYSRPASSSYVQNDRVAIFNSSNQLIYGSQP